MLMGEAVEGEDKVKGEKEVPIRRQEEKVLV